MSRQEMFKKILFWVFETKDQGQQAERVCELMKRVPDMDLMDLVLTNEQTQPILNLEVRS